MILNTVKRIQNTVRKLRISPDSLLPNENIAFDKPVRLEERFSLYHKNYTNRLVIFLKGTGCDLVLRTGGCTFCGFFEASNFGSKVDKTEVMNQIMFAINSDQFKFSDFPIISIYNDGSLLSESEFSFELLLYLLEYLNNIDSIQKITFEARVPDLKIEKLKKIKQTFKKDIEIAFGFESADPFIRRICINKNFNNHLFLNATKSMRDLGIDPVALIMFKPPFLTEGEAIQDMVDSFLFLEHTDVKRIDIELPTIQKHTLMHHLWQNGQYQLPKLWSVIEAIFISRKNGFSKEIYISPPNYTVKSLDRISNCSVCDEIIFSAFETFNQTQDTNVFFDLNCGCRDEYINQMNSQFQKLWKTDPESFLNSVNQQLDVCF